MSAARIIDACTVGADVETETRPASSGLVAVLMLEPVDHRDVLLRAIVAAQDIKDPSLASPHQLKMDLAEHGSLLRSRMLDGVNMVRCAQESACNRLYQKIWRVHRLALLELIAECSGKGVRLVVLKSAEYNERLFYSNTIREPGDIDLLIAKDDVRIVQDALRSLGYGQHAFDTRTRRLVLLDRSIISSYERSHFNMYTFSKSWPIDLSADEREVVSRGTVLFDEAGNVVVPIDVSTGVDSRIPTEELFAKSAQSVFSGALALSAEDSVWYTAALFFLHASRYPHNKLTPLAQLAALVKRTQIDWPMLVERVKLLEVNPQSVLDPLMYVDRLCSLSIPRGILRQLGPVPDRSIVIDRQLATL